MTNTRLLQCYGTTSPKPVVYQSFLAGEMIIHVPTEYAWRMIHAASVIMVAHHCRIVLAHHAHFTVKFLLYSCWFIVLLMLEVMSAHLCDNMAQYCFRWLTSTWTFWWNVAVRWTCRQCIALTRFSIRSWYLPMGNPFSLWLPAKVNQHHQTVPWQYDCYCSC